MRRMMKAGRASPAARLYAKIWRCPVCVEAQAPKDLQGASATERPFGFNVHVAMDLKYHHDIAGKQFVSLSVVDTGTSYHNGTLLKTRAAAYVAAKFIRHWCGHYGTPELVTIDQGGEFQAEFSERLEEMGIHSILS